MIAGHGAPEQSLQKDIAYKDDAETSQDTVDTRQSCWGQRCPGDGSAATARLTISTESV